MANSKDFVRISRIYTPTQMRPALGTMGHIVRWLIPPDPQLDKRVREFVDAITADLWMIGPEDGDMVASFLRGVEEPLEGLHASGFTLWYAVIDNTDALNRAAPPDWLWTVYIVMEKSITFITVDNETSRQFHLLNACSETEKSVVRAKGEGLIVIPASGFQTDWLDERKNWCDSCWNFIEANRSLLKGVFCKSSETAKKNRDHADVRAMLSLPAETDEVEFKETLHWDVRQGKFNDDRLMDVQKVICAMLNRNGGSILIGVQDEGNKPVGIAKDLEKYGSLDKFQRKIAEPFGIRLTPDPSELISVRFVELDGVTLARVDVRPDSSHCYSLLDKVYVRRDGESREMSGPNLAAWWARRIAVEIEGNVKPL